MATERLTLEVRGNVAGALRSLNKVEERQKRLKKQASLFNQTIASMRRAWLAVGAAVISIGVAIGSAIQKASDMQEANNKFAVTFKGIEANALAMRDELVKSYGQSTPRSYRDAFKDRGHAKWFWICYRRGT